MEEKMNRATKVFFLSLLFINVCGQCLAYDQLYIWQRNWNKHIEEAVASVMDTARYFIVLCGDMKFEGDKPVITPVNIKWEKRK